MLKNSGPLSASLTQNLHIGVPGSGLETLDIFNEGTSFVVLENEEGGPRAVIIGGTGRLGVMGFPDSVKIVNAAASLADLTINAGSVGRSFTGGSGNDSVTFEGGTNSANTLAGNDVVTITGGNNIVSLGSGSNSINVFGGTSTIEGGSDVDT